jgi:hypothetical protein
LAPVAQSEDLRVPNGVSRGLYDVVPRPDSNGEMWVAHVLLANETEQTLRSDGQGYELNFETTVFPAVSIIGREGARTAWLSAASTALTPAVRNPLGLQSVVSGPHSLAFTPDGRWALMVNQNSDDLTVIDAVARVEAPQGLVRPLGHMPDGIVINQDATRAYVDLRGDLAVQTLELTPQNDRLRVRTVGSPIAKSTRDPMPPMLRLGQRMFYSANSRETPITQNSWVACATCHLEGRTDAVTWKFDAGPRDTPSNAGGTLGNGPQLRTAQREGVEDYWRIITEEMGGDGDAFRDDPLLRPLLLALKDYVNLGIPYPVAPRTQAALVARGREIFQRPSVGCATCHAGTNFTDSGLGSVAQPRLYDVGTCNTAPTWPDRTHRTDNGSSRESCRFDTPTLRGIADSWPYLHDGSAQTLRQVLEITRGRMGDIRGLSEADLTALVEYMRSL